MKQVKIHTILSNSDNETTIRESLGTFDEENMIFNYQEEDLSVTLEVFDDKVIINRKNDDYDLTLELEKEKKVTSRYEVKSIGLSLDLEAYTKLLEISENIIYIEYELFNDNKSIGNFEFKFMFKEA